MKYRLKSHIGYQKNYIIKEYLSIDAFNGITNFLSRFLT